MRASAGAPFSCTGACARLPGANSSLSGSARCSHGWRACTTKMMVPVKSEQEKRALFDDMRAAVRSVLTAHNVVRLVASEKTRQTAFALSQAAAALLGTEWTNKQEFDRRIWALADGEDGFAAAAREELFPGELTPRA